MKIMYVALQVLVLQFLSPVTVGMTTAGCCICVGIGPGAAGAEAGGSPGKDGKAVGGAATPGTEAVFSFSSMSSGQSASKSGSSDPAAAIAAS